MDARFHGKSAAKPQTLPDTLLNLEVALGLDSPARVRSRAPAVENERAEVRVLRGFLPSTQAFVALDHAEPTGPRAIEVALTASVNNAAFLNRFALRESASRDTTSTWR